MAQGKLDIEAQCRGFLVLAKSAVAHLVGTIFGDSALAELFQKLYCSEDWQQGITTGSILATLGDYFDDFKQLLEPTFFKRCANLACAARGLPSCHVSDDAATSGAGWWTCAWRRLSRTL